MMMYSKFIHEIAHRSYLSAIIRKYRYVVILVIGCCLHPSTGFGQLEKVKAHYQQIQDQIKDSGQTITFVSKDSNLVDDFSRLSQIILVRHGEPALNKKGIRSRDNAVQFVENYDLVGIYKPAFMPVKLALDEVKVVHTSSINRSINTALKVLEPESILQPNALFREFERKVFGFPNIRLPLNWWLTGSRVLWFAGFNKDGIESFREAKRRAKTAADFLATDAEQHGKTLLVSHGLLNHFLVKYLEKDGWVQVYDGGKGYLSQKMLVKYK